VKGVYIQYAYIEYMNEYMNIFNTHIIYKQTRTDHLQNIYWVLCLSKRVVVSKKMTFFNKNTWM